MTALETASFAAAIASLVLAGVAIVLSIVFYKMSAQLAESTKEAARGIGASVEKLEKLFDRLYADTFSMMKDTVSDIRKHAWGEAPDESTGVLEEAEKRADEKMESLRERMEGQVSKVLEGQQLTDGRVKQIGTELSQLVGTAIEDSRHVEHEAREEAIQRYILRHLHMQRGRSRGVKADAIVSDVREHFPGCNPIHELSRMRERGVVAWGTDDLGPNTVITAIQKQATE